MPTPSPIVNLLLVLGLGFFFGLAFEEFYARDKQTRPGGIRSFPLLGLAGALLYRLDPAHLLASTWVKARFGSGGIEALAAIVGISDIDPFVLSLAQGGAPVLPVAVGAVAILIAAASNNILKAAYTLSFAGVRASMPAVIGLGVLAAGGLAAAILIERAQ